MTEGLRRCPGCDRHVKRSERECPFCRASLPLSFPDLPLFAREARPAPKYGGPPLRRPTTWLGCLLLAGLGALAFYLLQG